MKLIQCVSENIGGNIREAREKIMKAYALRGEDQDAAMWFRDMANAHIAFNEKGHSVVAKLINSYRASDAYREDPSYADGMKDAWEAIHNEQIRNTAEVRSMIDAFK